METFLSFVIVLLITVLLITVLLVTVLLIIAHSAAMIVYWSEGASEHLHTALHTATYTQYTTCALHT